MPGVSTSKIFRSLLSLDITQKMRTSTSGGHHHLMEGRQTPIQAHVLNCENPMKERKSMIAVSFIAAFLFLLVVRLVNEVNFPLLLNCFGQPGTKWIPFSYTYRRPLRTHYGYINVRTQEPLQLDCDLCAIVSNSGQMAGQKVGNEIDQSSCIWRMNNAPTKGYEEDVGRMTMIRVVSHTSVPLLLKNPDYFFKEANATIYVIWGPFRNMRKDGNGIVYNMLKKTVDIYPNAQIYVTTEKRMSYCDGIFKKETGKDRPVYSVSWRSENCLSPLTS
ncbi:alpha-N-acetylgalactosaminide alpha-2,6-sialyltransferase 3 isoform X3 [Acinonyx jubatus]|uniref:Alpha-N-acetylgalactosaminide alpha-2,6-sialyltransferase 3 isoform X3 n=1 Tax=Acinonyx jubatus TaxID=32536 RepID=A0ABM3PEY0_ACIJB|nr:alpha-N-acetylgalactosaminide alpha-2,6-sialyltransferase 3 isoform X3 [Acinonyx jubatus]